MNKTNKIIEIAPIDTKGVAEAEKQAVLTLSQAQGLIIKNQEGYDVAGTLLGAIKGRIKALDTLRKSITKPLDEAKIKVMDMFRVPLDHYTKAEVVIKTGMTNYFEVQEKIRIEQQARLEREATKKAAELAAKAEVARANGKEDKAEKYEEKAAEVVAPVLALRVEQVKGVHFIERWYAEVIDLKALSDDYKLPDMSKLNKVAQATKGTLTIAGVRFYSEKIVASRSI